MSTNKLYLAIKKDYLGKERIFTKGYRSKCCWRTAKWLVNSIHRAKDADITAVVVDLDAGTIEKTPMQKFRQIQSYKSKNLNTEIQKEFGVDVDFATLYSLYDKGFLNQEHTEKFMKFLAENVNNYC